MAQRAVQQRGLSIRAACQAFRISQACYRYEARRDTEDEEIAQWLGDVLFFVCGAVSESVLVSFSVVRG